MSQCRNSLCSAHTDSRAHPGPWNKAGMGTNEGTCAHETPHQKHRRAFLNLWFSNHLFNPFCFLMRCFRIKQAGGSSWQIILWWKPRMLIAFLPYFIWQICHQTFTWQERIPRGVASSLCISSPFPRKTCSGGLPEHTWSYLESGEGPYWEARREQQKPDLHIALILLKLRWVFDLPRCRSFRHI